jgi:hypothetical protein
VCMGQWVDWFVCGRKGRKGGKGAKEGQGELDPQVLLGEEPSPRGRNTNPQAVPSMGMLLLLANAALVACPPPPMI